jgi:TM2 domain-containing membrane protein YozV
MSQPYDAAPSGQQPLPPQQQPYPGSGSYPQQGQYPAQYQGGYPGPQPGGYPGGPYPQPYPAMIAPKSPGVAVLASFFIPGLGSMISGRGGMGALILCLYILSWILVVVFVGLFGVIGCWIWGMVQGYADAVAWNQQRGIIS